MKYLILVITIALIGCSAEPSSISGPSTYIEPSDSSQESLSSSESNEEIRSPFEWCADDMIVDTKNTYDTSTRPYVDCTTPINKDFYDRYYQFECFGSGACNPNGML